MESIKGTAHKPDNKVSKIVNNHINKLFKQKDAPEKNAKDTVKHHNSIKGTASKQKSKIYKHTSNVVNDYINKTLAHNYENHHVELENIFDAIVNGELCTCLEQLDLLMKYKIIEELLIMREKIASGFIKETIAKHTTLDSKLDKIVNKLYSTANKNTKSIDVKAFVDGLHHSHKIK